MLNIRDNFNNKGIPEKFYVETVGTAQSPHMPCFYSDIAMAAYDEKTMDQNFKPLTWKRFRDLLALWTHSDKDANH